MLAKLSKTAANPANWSENVWIPLIMLAAAAGFYLALVIAILGLTAIGEWL